MNARTGTAAVADWALGEDRTGPRNLLALLCTRLDLTPAVTLLTPWR